MVSKWTLFFKVDRETNKTFSLSDPSRTVAMVIDPESRALTRFASLLLSSERYCIKKYYNDVRVCLRAMTIQSRWTLD